VRVLLDTNVLFAAFVTHGVCAGLYEECLLQTEIVVSNHILTELAEKLVSKGGFTKSEALHVIRAVRRDTELVSPLPLDKPICRDPDDDWVLAAATAGKVDVIVTGDRDLLVLKRFLSIPIVTPRGFLELLHLQQ
jgi:putative PIN family toxin of toxin-antitoxin system